MKDKKPPSISIEIFIHDRNSGMNISNRFKGCDETGLYSYNYNEAIEKAIKFLIGIRDTGVKI